jgi:osomolarity two-component system, phosphorelay intermediate protein YPD1
VLTSDHRRKGDLKELSQLGHFLKGSSAALGLCKIKNACEKIQNLGEGKSESGLKESSDKAYALAQIQSTLKDLKTDYSEVKSQLLKFYGEA